MAVCGGEEENVALLVAPVRHWQKGAEPEWADSWASSPGVLLARRDHGGVVTAGLI